MASYEGGVKETEIQNCYKLPYKQQQYLLVALHLKLQKVLLKHKISDIYMSTSSLYYMDWHMTNKTYDKN
jgi:hypothetical protein